MWTLGEGGTGAATSGMGWGVRVTRARARTEPRGESSSSVLAASPSGAGHVIAQASVSPRVKQEASQQASGAEREVCAF